MSTRKPLEVLVISQLADIRKHEAALENQMQLSSGSEAGTFAAAIAQLKDRADRLGRMLDAMEMACGHSSFSGLQQAVA